MQQELASLLAGQMSLPGTSWSVGEGGALAEFHHNGPARCRALTLDAPDGALVIQRRPCTAIAFETASACSGESEHRVALCLPDSDALMPGRATLTELGPDTAAAEPGDRGGILFDLGLGLATIDFCIRTADSALLGSLRTAIGTRVLDNQPLLAQIGTASPHRVVMSRLARIEVRGPIPAPGTQSPPGPHTHLLPRLLAGSRAHAKDPHIPSGLLPCLWMYPAQPVRLPQGMR